MKLSVKTIFLILTILISGLFVWPELNFQDNLAQGDHGRDLYAFDAVTKGDLPYHDFWWVYGPLMPYYYGLFFKIFGTHISSVLLGRALLVVLCSVFFYLSASCLMTPGLAFLASLWVTQSRQEFFFTYNRIGGIAAELFIIFCLLSYLQIGAIRYLWLSLLAAFILALIKINFGLAALAGIVIGVLWIDYSKQYRFSLEKKKFYLGAVFFVPLALSIIYGLLLKNLPLYAIRQCMPYFGDDQPYHASPWMVIPYYFMQHFLTLVKTKLGIPIGIILHGATLLGAWALIFKKVEKEHRQNILLGLGILGIFFVVYFHEFLVSGIWYRCYWSMPFLDMFHFVMIGLSLLLLPKIVRIFILIVLWTLTLLGIAAHIGSIQAQKTPDRYLREDRGRIYTANEPQWTDTVTRVSDYLNAALQKDETFLALPYDCLYYYLTNRQSPTRQLIFFDHIKIPQEQEVSIIKELEKKNMAYVLMSNRMISDENGLGVFGKTYCPLLGQYIQAHYKPLIRQGGDWTKRPGPMANHGVIILKRIS
ncbi:MAG: glycosyltransferase family 39 protein [Candidatus Omnitrophica bacterium]|nr:glycosyltransferase family 39 protein [Candidatus Omnitrophota bacterium]